MSHSPDAEDYVIAEWRAALADAGVAENDFHLITCLGAPVTGFVKAVSFDPGLVLRDDADEGGIVVHTDKLADANENANLWRHRVGALEDVDQEDEVELAVLAGLLRHEIEHGKQREVAREGFGLYDITELVAYHIAAGDRERERDVFHSSPIEADADAAASAHIRKRYPNAVAALLAGPDHYLVRATAPPGDPKTLVERTRRLRLAVPRRLRRPEAPPGWAHLCRHPR